MKLKPLLALLVIASVLSSPALLRAEDAAAASPIQTELKSLIQSVQTKISNGKKTETDLADDLKRFDTLIAQENGAKTDEAAQIVFMKAMLYIEVLDQTEKGTALIQQIKTDYPDTKVGKQADRVLQSLEKQNAAKKNKAQLADGVNFPDFLEKDLLGQPLSVAQFKGKVVLVDFWATWCGPCRAELPNVIETYQKYHAKGFAVIGVSLDSDREKLDAFLKKQEGMTWPQYFDGEGWSNKLAVKYGVESIPFTVLIGTDGKIIGKDLRGEALGEAVATALGKK